VNFIIQSAANITRNCWYFDFLPKLTTKQSD